MLLSKKVDLTVTSHKIFNNCSKQVDPSPDFLGGIQGLHDLQLAFVSDFISEHTWHSHHTWLVIFSKIQSVLHSEVTFPSLIFIEDLSIFKSPFIYHLAFLEQTSLYPHVFEFGPSIEWCSDRGLLSFLVSGVCVHLHFSLHTEIVSFSLWYIPTTFSFPTFAHSIGSDMMPQVNQKFVTALQNFSDLKVDYKQVRNQRD